MMIIKKSKKKLNKKGRINMATINSDSDTNNSSSSDFGSNFKTGSDSEESLFEAESDYSYNIHISKAKKNK